MAGWDAGPGGGGDRGHGGADKMTPPEPSAEFAALVDDVAVIGALIRALDPALCPVVVEMLKLQRWGLRQRLREIGDG